MSAYERQFSEITTTGVPADELAAWCRNPESRICWPGAGGVRNQGDAIYFQLNMQAPGGPAATGMMEEQLHSLHPAPDGGSEFKSRLTLTWPSGEVGSGEATYRFRHDTGTTTFAFSLEYVLPKKLGVGMFNRGRFLDAVDKALSLYAKRLAAGPGAAPTGAGAASSPAGA